MCVWREFIENGVCVSGGSSLRMVCVSGGSSLRMVCVCLEGVH